jgi:hypothetical protein
LYDPSVDSLQSTIRGIRKAKAEGWHSEITLTPPSNQSKAVSDYCHLTGEGSGWRKIENYPEKVVGKVTIGAAKASVECYYENSSCKVAGSAFANDSTFSGLSVTQSGDCAKRTYLYPSNGKGTAVTAEGATGCTIKNLSGASASWKLWYSGISGDLKWSGNGTVASQGPRLSYTCSKN